jgi:hypothetical protein
MSLARLWQQQGKQQEDHRMLFGIHGWFTEQRPLGSPPCSEGHPSYSSGGFFLYAPRRTIMLPRPGVPSSRVSDPFVSV